jgi:glutathione S-transferase
MLERKGIEHKVVDVVPGFQPLVVRVVGFRGITVPALRIDGRRVQGSRQISRFLEGIVPLPALFPADPSERRAVEEAERWGEETLQPIPRRLFRWGAAKHQYLRRWIASEVVGVPAPGAMARANAPIARKLANMVDARDDAVRGDLTALPDLLAHADALIAEGTIGGDSPNAADFQIATSVRVLLAFEGLRPMVESRPIGELARRILPLYPGPIPRFLPPVWL